MAIFRTLILVLFFLSAPVSHADALLKDVQGNQIPFSTLKGKWVFINYWASWCPSCLEEIPEFNKFYQRHKKDSIALFAVNFDGLPLAEQSSLIKRFNITYPSLSQDPSTALQLGGIRGIPVTFVFNPKGELATTLYGPQTLKGLDDMLTDPT